MRELDADIEPQFYAHTERVNNAKDRPSLRPAKLNSYKTPEMMKKSWEISTKGKSSDSSAEGIGRSSACEISYSGIVQRQKKIKVASDMKIKDPSSASPNLALRNPAVMKMQQTKMRQGQIHPFYKSNSVLS